MSESAEVAQDLVEKVSALRNLTTIYKLLDQGHYRHNFGIAVSTSLKFVESLHASLKAECFTHPDCDKLPELVDLKKLETPAVQPDVVLHEVKNEQA